MADGEMKEVRDYPSACGFFAEHVEAAEPRGVHMNNRKEWSKHE